MQPSTVYRTNQRHRQCDREREQSQGRRRTLLCSLWQRAGNFLALRHSSEHSRTLGPPSTPCSSDASLKWTDIKASSDFDPAIPRFVLSLLDRLIKSDGNERWVCICRKFQRFLRRNSPLFLTYGTKDALNIFKTLWTYMAEPTMNLLSYELRGNDWKINEIKLGGTLDKTGSWTYKDAPILIWTCEIRLPSCAKSQKLMYSTTARQNS